MTIQTKKAKLIQQIHSIDDEKLIDNLTAMLEKNKIDSTILQYARPIRKKTDLNELLDGYTFNERRFRFLIDEINVKEPLEDLLEMLD